MSAVREPCPNCQLPYYTDRNSDCPYCGATATVDDRMDESDATAVTASDASAPTTEQAADEASAAVDTSPAGSVVRSTPPSRPRATCSNCGLPHYADDDNGCPYCASAGVSESVEQSEASTETTGDDESEPVHRETETAAGPAASADTGSSGEGGSNSGGLLSRLRGLFGG